MTSVHVFLRFFGTYADVRAFLTRLFGAGDLRRNAALQRPSLYSVPRSSKLLAEGPTGRRPCVLRYPVLLYICIAASTVVENIKKSRKHVFGKTISTYKYLVLYT